MGGGIDGVGIIVGGTGATISPCRAVALDTAGVAEQVIQSATANGLCYGIAQDWEQGAPGVTGSDVTVAGKTGDMITVYPPWRNCLAEIGSTITLGQELASDANGRLVPYTDVGAGNVWIVGWCIRGVTVTGTNYPRVPILVTGYWKYLSS